MVVKNKILEYDFLGYKVRKYLYFFVGLFVLTIIIAIWIGLLESFRLVFGSLYALFVPGFLISHIFYEKNKIDLTERLSLSFALSISVVPLIVFYLNIAGVPVSTLNSVLTISGVSLLTIIWLVLKKKI